MAVLLFVGSWLLGLRALIQVIHQVPRILILLKLTHAVAGSTIGLWVVLVLAILTCLTGGLLLLFSGIFLVLIEGTQVLVDEEGITIEQSLLPTHLAHKFGSGRLGWKQIGKFEKRFCFFVIRPNKATSSEGMTILLPTLRFLMVDQIDRLVFMIIERSPNLLK